MSDFHFEELCRQTFMCYPTMLEENSRHLWTINIPSFEDLPYVIVYPHRMCLGGGTLPSIADKLKFSLSLSFASSPAELPVCIALMCLVKN